MLLQDQGRTCCHRLADRLLVATSKRQWKGNRSNQANAQEPKAEGSVSMESVCEYVWALVTEVGDSALDTIDLNRLVSNVMIAVVTCVKPPHNMIENCDLDVHVASKYP
ncbi:unnamed protein product [Albugo candida]|uniref:Uncharacterized protein n=1 Tax=Albugo candida TaxID=65357 RepID=A0A024FWR1_9STRA|nr:unnamed protein product [Albugo candida]|eukprot:CCI11362.1 unnamed protein product [Albugo candida]